MDKTIFSTKDMVKYLIIGGLIYTILKIIPSTQLSNKDLILLLAIITVGFVCLDCLFLKKVEKFTNDDDPFALDLDTDIYELIKKRQNIQQEAKPVILSQPEAKPVILSQPEAKPVILSQPEAKPVILSQPEAKPVIAEKTIVENDYIDALKNYKNINEKLVRLNQIKQEAINQGAINEVKNISQEIDVISKAKAIAEEHVNIIEQRKDIIDKKLTNMPVNTAEEKRIALEENNILSQKVQTNKEYKDFLLNNKKSTENDVNQVLHEIHTSTVAQTKAEERAHNIINNSSSHQIPQTSCGFEVEKIKRQMEDEMSLLREQLKAKLNAPSHDSQIANKYFGSLINDLVNRNILDSNDVSNIQAKLQSGVLTLEEIIMSLETLKREGKSKNRTDEGKVIDDKRYSELPSDFYTPIGKQVPNEWSNEYTILDTNKWQVPMARPPVCINTQPCKVCPTDISSNSVNLKEWDDSRYVMGGRINKQWAGDQLSA